ncbi:putative pre-rrna-processing protein esf2 [Erysiphe necator]|uniref:18S rRNA factor 2 n=1 Tax=Uncinula necator TaxID=52586 RepID=A0A0B1PB42_UNCNE|nr:putative pre-rrna-processing protein esf2 [Erysiphe necator]
MATRKLNEYLDISDSESNHETENESDAEEIKKGGRTPKRKKVENFLSDGEEPDSDQNNIEGGLKNINNNGKLRESSEEKDLSDTPKKSKPILKKNLVATNEAIKRSGVVYLSRIPPYMKASKLRSLLEPYGAINRIFLTPEDPSAHSRRIRNGGNKKRSFVDGWVEFVKKSEAKAACELLNARTIGGKKGTYYHDDVWNLLYLKGFKWNNLTEQIAAENAERASRMRAEISKTTKENKEFLKNVERAKVLRGIEAKKIAKSSNDKNSNITVVHANKPTERARIFKQRTMPSKHAPELQPERIKSILGKIF